MVSTPASPIALESLNTPLLVVPPIVTVPVPVSDPAPDASPRYRMPYVLPSALPRFTDPFITRLFFATRFTLFADVMSSTAPAASVTPSSAHAPVLVTTKDDPPV